MLKLAYIGTGKNISLKTFLDKNGISLNGDDIVSHDISKPIKPLQTVKNIHVTKGYKKIIENASFKMTLSKKIKMVATVYYPGDPLVWKNGTTTFLG
ncbi:hypothetical protein ATZ36_01905 [Candidatus Endomicrobiellum trichonymphae]|uniref:Uncharacterized protein n=1 Tax=Endomicrobium trichonymphae TaxID=1408204 RepID=A0A1E5IGZ3_ENDTX|nr:hypothetical protein ATZ36_01905 [Candidatus Endomicrobium trichonymphae]